MKVNHLIKIGIVIGIFGTLLEGCQTPENKAENEYKLKSVWELDSVSGDSVLLPFEREFDSIVDHYLGLIEDDRDSTFLYNVHLDTLYRWYDIEGRPPRSVRAAIIGEIKDVDYLIRIIKDENFITVWENAKRDSTILRTNIEIINDRLKDIESE